MATRDEPGGSNRPTATQSFDDPNQGQQSRGPAQQAKDEAKHLAAEAKHETVRMVEKARDHVGELVSERKEQAAQQLGSLAGALREAAHKLQEGEGAGLGRYADQAAGQVDRVSNYLRQGDLRSLMRDAEDFARRRPDLFLGGTFLAGLLLARFLKSSGARTEDWQPAYGTGYSGYGTTYGSQPYGTDPATGGGEGLGSRPYEPSTGGL